MSPGSLQQGPCSSVPDGLRYMVQRRNPQTLQEILAKTLILDFHRLNPDSLWTSKGVHKEEWEYHPNLHVCFSNQCVSSVLYSNVKFGPLPHFLHCSWVHTDPAFTLDCSDPVAAVLCWRLQLVLDFLELSV